MNTDLEKIKNLLKTIPQTPGVYKMKDDIGMVLYIGKAKNLRHRVAQYFQLSKGQSIKVKKMIERVHDVDVIETNNDMEALLLETNLIKELRPRYNVLMKDDKNYVYIKVSTHEDYPRLSIVRRREKDQAIYFGPRTSADACEKLLNILRKIFPIRTCTLEMEDGPDGLIRITKKTIPVPCLDYHIKRCNAPCIDKIKKEEYNDMIKKIVRFLKGNYQELITKLKYDMFNFAHDKKFESAARVRDQMKALEAMFAKQLVSDPEFFDRDVIGIFPDFDKTFINLFQFREGKLINQENFTLDTPQQGADGTEEERTSTVIESFFRSYYSDTTDIPSDIYLCESPLEKDLWQDWLTERRKEIQKQSGEWDQKKVHFLNPLIGKKNKVLELSEKNAATFARQSRAKWMSDAAKTTQAANDLASELGIEKQFHRIECYDISHLGGEETTASMVVFIKGAPEKKLYRHFKLKTLEAGEIDDYKALEEILTRRLQRLTQFDTGITEHYTFKKPLKKDLGLIEQSLKDEGLTTNYQLPTTNYLGLYHHENQEDRLVGYSQLIHHKKEDQLEIGATWIEGEHLNRALKHQLWRKLFEKIKKPYLYGVCKPDEKEDYLSFGFTELKKIPEFLVGNVGNVGNVRNVEKQDPNAPNVPHVPHVPNGPAYLIYKITKKTVDTSFSEVPDLIIIDGGKGQLSVVQKVMKTSGLDIPIIALAKREEEIFIALSDTEEDAFPKSYKLKAKSCILPRHSQALYLVQRIRDESHRFANELRKKLGTKKLTASEIDDIPGIGQIIKRRLLKEYGSINAIKAAPMEHLEKIVGSYIAKMLKKRL